MKHGANCILLVLGFIAAASLACSRLALPALIATPTFTPTDTPTASPTAVPTLTPTLRPTATTKPTGTELLDQADGSKLFVDYEGGYQIELSSYWSPLRLSKSDLDQAMSQAEELNPDLKQQFEAFRKLDPEVFRLFAFSKEAITGGYLTNLNVARVQSGLAAGLPFDLLIKANVEAIKKQLPDATITQGEIKANAHGIEIGSIEIEKFKMQVPSGSPITLYEKQLYFVREDSLIIITLATTEEDFQSVLPHFDELFDTIAEADTD